MGKLIKLLLIIALTAGVAAAVVFIILPMFDEQGNSIKSNDYQSIALYYCPKCMKFIAHNNMA